MSLNKTSFTQQLFWGLIPLIVFILAESVFETTISAIISVSFGIIIFILQLVKYKVLDKFLLIDIAALSILGGATALFKSELFIKLKPGFTQTIFLIYLAIILFSNHKTFKQFTERFSFGKFVLSDDNVNLLRKNMKLMLYVLVIHTLLVFYAAFYWSMTVCVFISGVGFFVAAAIAIFAPLIIRKIRSIGIEFVPIVDEQGKVVDKATREYVHNGSHALHPVVHLQLINRSWQIFLQKRSSKSKIQPGKWDSAVGGHVKWNETIEQALEREMYEETKLKLSNVSLLSRYIWNSDIESELVFSFIQITDKEPTINPLEAEQGRWWTIPQIEESAQEIFTPNFLYELSEIKAIIKKNKKTNR